MTTPIELRVAAENHRDRIQALVDKVRASDDEEVAEELWDLPLCSERLTTIRVTLGTGGPAYGVDFRVDTSEDRTTLEGATVWHQDWFTEREHVDLDDETAEYLFECWIAE